MFDDKGEFKGSIMVIEDISNVEELQAELRRKEEDFERLECKFRDVHNKLQITKFGQLSVDQNFMKLNEEKQKNY